MNLDGDENWIVGETGHFARRDLRITRHESLDIPKAPIPSYSLGPARLHATLMGMAKYRVQVSYGPHSGISFFPSLEAAITYRDWLKANNVAESAIRIVCTEL